MELFSLPTPPTSCPLRRADSASSIKQHECGRAATVVSPFIILTNFHTLFNYISLWWLHDIKLFYCFRFLAGILSAKAQNWRVIKSHRINDYVQVGSIQPPLQSWSALFFTGAQIIARKWVAFFALSTWPRLLHLYGIKYGEKFKRILPQQLLDHTERLCPLTVIDCDYIALGCTIKVRDLFCPVCFGQFCLFYLYYFF